MITLFKSKPNLKDLIPDYHVDIHSHLLYGIDDGAKSFENTLALTQALQNFGFTQFITTPHVIHHVWENSTEKIKAKELATITELAEHQINVPFHAAAEYMLDDNFSQLFQTEKLLTLQENYVLVEMSYINAPFQLYTFLFDLQVAGYIPVLAHPERYLFYHSNFDEYLKLKKAGCLFQLNLLSTVGYYGKEIVKAADILLQKGLIDFVGSDVHHSKHIAAFDQKIKIKDTLALMEAIENNQFFRKKS